MKERCRGQTKNTKKNYARKKGKRRLKPGEKNHELKRATRGIKIGEKKEEELSRGESETSKRLPNGKR